MSSLHTAISTPSFCSFWHGHPYIPIHFLKMFFILVIIATHPPTHASGWFCLLIIGSQGTCHVIAATIHSTILPTFSHCSSCLFPFFLLRLFLTSFLFLTGRMKWWMREEERERWMALRYLPMVFTPPSAKIPIIPMVHYKSHYIQICISITYCGDME